MRGVWHARANADELQMNDFQRAIVWLPSQVSGQAVWQAGPQTRPLGSGWTSGSFRLARAARHLLLPLCLQTHPDWCCKTLQICGWLGFGLGCQGTELRTWPELSRTLAERPRYGEAVTQKYTATHEEDQHRVSVLRDKTATLKSQDVILFFFFYSLNSGLQINPSRNMNDCKEVPFVSGWWLSTECRFPKSSCEKYKSLPDEFKVEMETFPSLLLESSLCFTSLQQL